MAGVAGRSGRRRKPLADHLLMGTYRRDRHGPLPAHVAVMPAAPPSWQPTPEDLEGLGEAGRRFVAAMLEQFDTSSLIEGTLLIQAAACLDGLAIWRPLATTDKQAARLVLS